MTRVISFTEALSAPRNTTGSMIHCPFNIFDRMLSMVNDNRHEETIGIMLAHEPKPGQYIICNLLELNIGTMLQVGHDERNLNAALTVKNIANQSGYNITVVEFHTHTKIMCDPYPEGAVNFSEQDYYAYSQRKIHIYGDKYVHTLFTPTHVLTLGSTLPSFTVLDQRNPALEKVGELMNKQYHQLVR